MKVLDPTMKECHDMSGATDDLAEFIASTRAVPETTSRVIVDSLLDFVGLAAFAGRFAESSPAFRAGAMIFDYKGPYTVIGDPHGHSLAAAALLNGAFAHTLDFDDTNAAGTLHPGAPIIAAAMAQAEQQDVSGRDFVAAVALGYEVACRVGAAMGEAAYARGFHLTSVAGIFGAVATIARLQRLPASSIADALGLAGSLAAGSMQYLDSGAWNKRLHPGFAAQGALQAVALARAGVRGAREPIEGRLGALHAYSPKPKPERLLEGLGSCWISDQTAIKPYPSCRLTHGAIDAARALRARVPADCLADVTLAASLSPTAFDVVGQPRPNKIAPSNIVDGQFSVYFQLAMAWLEGEVAWTSYDRLGAPDVGAFMSRIRVLADPSLQVLGCELRVDGHPGLVERIEAPLGEPSNPLGRHELVAKFMSLAVPVFGDKRAAAIVPRILHVRGEPSVLNLIAMLRG